MCSSFAASFLVFAISKVVVSGVAIAKNFAVVRGIERFAVDEDDDEAIMVGVAKIDLCYTVIYNALIF